MDVIQVLSDISSIMDERFALEGIAFSDGLLSVWYTDDVDRWMFKYHTIQEQYDLIVMHVSSEVELMDAVYDSYDEFIDDMGNCVVNGI